MDNRQTARALAVRLAKVGGTSCYPLNNEEGALAFITRLHELGAPIEVEFSETAGWKVTTRLYEPEKKLTPFTEEELAGVMSNYGVDEGHFLVPRLIAMIRNLQLHPDLTKVSLAELMQQLRDTEEPKPSYGPIELRILLHHVREVVRAAWVLMDNSEDTGMPPQPYVIQKEDFDSLAKAMDRLDEIAALDTQVVGRGGHAVTMAMDILARNNKDVRDTLVRELCDNILALNTSERSKEIGKATFLAALMKYNRDHSGG